MQIKMIKTGLLLSALSIITTAALAAEPPATIDDLDWMTGTYAGALGPNQLEENWIKAEGASIAAMVRSTGNNVTNMFEMITIEEMDGSLVLHIQQFNPGFVARTPAPQKMTLAMITGNHVHFVSASEGSMKSLGYTKEGDKFTIHVEQASGQKIDIPLMERDVWN